LLRSLLHEELENPDPFEARPGLFAWLQGSLRDRTAWRAVAYFVIKVPLCFLAIYTAFSLWWDAFFCLLRPFFGQGGSTPPVFGLLRNAIPPGYLSVGSSGFFHGIGIMITGAVFFFAAPWAVKAINALDRILIHSLLGPDAVAVRMRSLEYARAQTVDASAATLRRIERDLHDGTQAQLVALAMRLGMAKEKLEAGDSADLEQVRQLVDDAHRGAKEAIVELRDLARGIHPPALDIGLEGALATLAARSPVPTECTVGIADRPTPAIESIAYFCVAELLANVAQHAQAARATINATQSGAWLRLVVRDDGVGGAQLSTHGTSSSGLSGLTDRVHAVDGRLHFVSPIGGPTVVTVDLPLHA
jgi:signal transduction histidine kinase